MEVDFGRTAADYGRYRAGFPDELFERLAALGIGIAGQRVLDLGTGTGSFGRGFALRGCRVTGLDRSSELMAEARRLDAEAGVSVGYMVATAEDSGLPGAAFEVVGAGQCWHWFERARAAREARRLLTSGGALVIAHFDWLPRAGSVVEATERLIEEHNPEWRMGGGTGEYPAWLDDLAKAGFRNIDSFTFDVTVPYGHEAWRGRIRASAGVGASLPPERVAAFDAALAKLLEERFPAEPLAAPHRVFAAFGRKP